MSALSWFFSQDADPFWYWARNAIGAVVAITVVGESAHHIPPKWLPTRFRTESAHHEISRRSWAILVFALALEVPIEMARDSIAARAIRGLEEKFDAERTSQKPRQMSIAQSLSFTNSLKQFSGQRFSGLVLPAAGDSIELWREIAGVLTGAGWVFVGKKGPLSVGDPPANIAFAADPDVMLLIKQPSSAATDDAALELARLLLMDGIFTRANRDADPLSGNLAPGTIIIEVGLKTR